MGKYNYLNQLMKLLNFKTLCVIFLVVIQTQLLPSYPSYAEYVKTFGKQYKTTEEYLKHEEIYNKRISGFSKETSYTPGVNPMSDLFPQQIQKLKNLKKADVSTRLARPPPLLSRLGYPISLDWRDSGVITSIKDQGYCGGCWAFATVAHVQSKLIIANRFTKNNIDLAEQYLLSCTYDSTCNGGYLEQSLRQAHTLPSQNTYPYSPYSAQPSDICSANGVIAGDSNADYYNLADSQLIALLQTGPVAISISSNGWQNYGSGTFSCSANEQVNHAVLLIGYTADYWIIKNQWGPLWGMGGFMRITRNRSTNCAIGYSAHVLVGEGNSANDDQFRIDYNGTTPKNDTNSNTTTNNNTQKTKSLFGNSYTYILSMGLLLVLVLYL